MSSWYLIDVTSFSKANTFHVNSHDFIYGAFDYSLAFSQTKLICFCEKYDSCDENLARLLDSGTRSAVVFNFLWENYTTARSKEPQNYTPQHILSFTPFSPSRCRLRIFPPRKVEESTAGVNASSQISTVARCWAR